MIGFPSPLPFSNTRLRYGQVSFWGSLSSKNQEEPSYAPSLKVLLDLLGERVRNAAKVPQMVRKESLKAILLLSDMFVNISSFEWMLVTFLEVLRSTSPEDALLQQYAVVGVCKAISALRIDAANYSSEMVTAIDRSLRHDHPSLAYAAIHGVLYLLEGKCTLLVRALLPVLTRHLTTELHEACSSGQDFFTSQPELISTMLSTIFLLIEEFPKELEEQDFTKKSLASIMGLACREFLPDQVFHTILRGLERLLLSFSLGHSLRDDISNIALDRYLTNWPRALSALSFQLTCIYTGQIGAPLNPALTEQFAFFFSFIFIVIDFQHILSLSFSFFRREIPVSSSSALVTDKVMIMFDRIRVKAVPKEAMVISSVLPHVLLDFFPAQQILTTVVGELLVLSSYNKHLAVILNEVFRLLAEKDPANTDFMANWVLLSLNPFLQKPRKDLAAWCILCLFISVSRNPLVKSL